MEKTKWQARVYCYNLARVRAPRRLVIITFVKLSLVYLRTKKKKKKTYIIMAAIDNMVYKKLSDTNFTIIFYVYGVFRR